MNPITREAKPAITETPPSPGCGNELQRSSHARHPTETSSPCVKRIIVNYGEGHGATATVMRYEYKDKKHAKAGLWAQ